MRSGAPARGPSHGVGSIVAIAVWLGAGIGVMELLVLAVLKFGMGRFLWLSPHVVWMTPLATTVVAVVLAVPLAFAARRFPRLLPPVAVVTLIALPLFISLLMVYPRLGRLAVSLLATGLAFQTARFVVGRSAPVLKTLRRRAVWVAVGIGAVAVGDVAIRWGAERWSMARLSDIDSSSPNVLLIILDTVRATNLSLYGYDRTTTPVLDELSRRGVVFDRPIAPSSWTLPSHASLFTGRMPNETGASWRVPLDDTYPTLAEAFREQGYSTGGFVANILYCGYETGIDRGFIRYEDYRISVAEIALSFGLGRTIANNQTLRRRSAFYDIVDRKTGADVARDFLKWEARSDRPFFAFLNFLDAHEPYESPPEYSERFGSTADRQPWRYDHGMRVAVRWGKSRMPAAELQAELNAYDGAIAYLDHQIGVVLDSLERRGRLDNTIVIVTSDHGEHFGEQALFGHGNGLYMPAIHVPLLIVHGKELPGGLRVRAAQSLRDIPATLWSLAGFAGAGPFPGTPLDASWASGDSAALSTVVAAEFTETVGEPQVRSVIVDDFQYIRSVFRDSTVEELYDLNGDPAQLSDLASAEDHAGRLHRMRALLDSDGESVVAAARRD